MAVYLDTNYNASFALMHEDYQHNAAGRARTGKAQTPRAVADRPGREQDRPFASRADEAVAGYVGGEAMLRLNIEDAVRIAGTGTLLRMA